MFIINIANNETKRGDYKQQKVAKVLNSKKKSAIIYKNMKGRKI